MFFAPLYYTTLILKKEKCISRFFQLTHFILHSLSALAVSLCLILTCSIVIPQIIQNKTPHEQTYLDEELDKNFVSQDVFNDSLKDAQINIVDTDNYLSEQYLLYLTKDNKVVGGAVSLVGEDEDAILINMEFYIHSVIKEDNANIVYDKIYSTNGAQIEYGLKEHFEEYGLYTYYIKTEYNSLNYYIEYTCMDEDIRPFLDEIFS